MDSAEGGRPESTSGGVWAVSHRRLTIGLLLTISITAFEALAVATVLPATAMDLGGGDFGWYGWVFSGFMLANLVGIPAAGVLADRGGPARPFVVGCALFAAGLLVAGVAPSMACVVFGRVAQGLGAGALSSIAYVAVARGYAPVDQPRMLALLASAWIIPGIAGPSVAAALAGEFGWRSVFLLLVPFTLAGALLAVKGPRDLADAGGAKTAHEQIRPALQLAAAAGFALFGAEASHPVVAFACVAAGVAAALPALRRLLPEGTMSAARGAPAALATKALVTFAFFGTEAFLPLALTVVRDEPMRVAGFALTAGTLGWTAGAWIQDRLAMRVDRVALVRSGLVLTAVAVAGSAYVLVAPWPAAVAIVSWTLAGLGIGISYSTSTLIVFELTPGGDEGAAASALQLVNVLGVALGAGVGGAALAIATAHGHSQGVGIAVVDVIMFAVAVVGLMAAGRSGRPVPAPSHGRVLPVAS